MKTTYSGSKNDIVLLDGWALMKSVGQLKKQVPSTLLGLLPMLNKCQVNEMEEFQYTFYEGTYLCLNL